MKIKDHSFQESKPEGPHRTNPGTAQGGAGGWPVSQQQEGRTFWKLWVLGPLRRGGWPPPPPGACRGSDPEPERLSDEAGAWVPVGRPRQAFEGVT